MPISFPTSPATNATYTYLGKTWTWTGALWQANATPMGPTGPTGSAGPTGPTGPTGPQPSLTATLNSVSATTYSIVTADKDKLIQTTNGTGVTITVDSVLTAGQRIDVIQYGAGQITFVAGSGVTLHSAAGKLKINVQYSAATVMCVASGLYVLIGDLA